MANPDDIIDPNDLDSIDALLDEAGWSVDEDLDAPESAEPLEENATSNEVVAEEDSVEEALVDEFDLDSIQAEADIASDVIQEDVAEELADAIEEATEAPMVETDNAQSDTSLPDVETLTEEQETSTGLLDDAMAAAPVAPVQSAVAEEKKIQASPSTDEDELEKRLMERQKNQTPKNDELTVEQMDTLKKLIIIFGSISIVLLLTGIGLTTWAALSASSAGISEENQTLFESIKVNSDLNSELSRANNEVMSGLEKKIDAINFQIEQLAVDLADASKKAEVAQVPVHATNVGHDAHGTQVVIDPLGLSTHKTDVKHAAPAVVPVAAPVVPAQVDVKVNAEITKTMSSMNYKLIKAQKNIDDLMTRLKAVQAEQKKLLESVKTVEKEVLTEKAEKLRAQKAVEQKTHDQQNRYQYQSGDVFHDQGSHDSYP